MKLSTREARAFLRKPEGPAMAALVSGQDAGRVAEARRGLAQAWAGEQADEEMRLTRLSGAELRREPALLLDALKAVGFFPGPRLVVLEEATDGLAPLLAEVLGALAPGDARLLATAGALTARSALRKLFEAAPQAVALTLYDDPPDAAEIAERLRVQGIEADPEARAALLAQAGQMDAAEFRGLLERLALHHWGEAGPVTAAEVAALAPEDAPGDLDGLLAAVTDGRRAEVPERLRALESQGVGPVTIAVGLLRHLRAVHAVSSDPGGVAAGMGRLRPPLGGTRRAAVERAAGTWRRERLEDALRAALALDMELRSSTPAPEGALVERLLLRLAR
jgi:DNA polymerase III subunit delta